MGQNNPYLDFESAQLQQLRAQEADYQRQHDQWLLGRQANQLDINNFKIQARDPFDGTARTQAASGNYWLNRPVPPPLSKADKELQALRDRVKNFTMKIFFDRSL